MGIGGHMKKSVEELKELAKTLRKTTVTMIYDAGRDIREDPSPRRTLWLRSILAKWTFALRNPAGLTGTASSSPKDTHCKDSGRTSEIIIIILPWMPEFPAHRFALRAYRKSTGYSFLNWLRVSGTFFLQGWSSHPLIAGTTFVFLEKTSRNLLTFQQVGVILPNVDKSTFISCDFRDRQYGPDRRLCSIKGGTHRCQSELLPIPQ